MATVGSAVGLGNLWSYPYKMGKNGGAAFLFIYLILTVLVGVVLMLAELGLGRKTGRGVVYAYRRIDKKFTFVGIFGWLAPLLILGFYTMLGGFCIKYTVVNLGDFLGASFGLGAADSSAYFSAFSADEVQTVIYTLVFILVTMIIVGAGITDGIEKFDKAYEDGIIDKIITTNLIYQKPELQSRPWYVCCSMSKYLAYLIDTLNHDSSISDLLDPKEKIWNIVERYNKARAEGKKFQ